MAAAAACHLSTLHTHTSISTATTNRLAGRSAVGAKHPRAAADVGANDKACLPPATQQRFKQNVNMSGEVDAATIARVGLASVAQVISGINGHATQTTTTADWPPSSHNPDSSSFPARAEYPLPATNVGLAGPPLIAVHDPFGMWQFLEPPLRQRLSAFRFTWGDGRVLRDIDFEFSTSSADNSKRFVASQPHAYLAPFMHIYVLKCEDLDTYRGQVRPRLRAWVSEMNQRNEEWLVVYIPLATDSIQSNSMPRRIFDKLRVDFGSSSAASGGAAGAGSASVVARSSAARRLAGAAAAAGLSVNTRRSSASGSTGAALSAKDRCCRVALFDEPNRGISPSQRSRPSATGGSTASPIISEASESNTGTGTRFRDQNGSATAAGEAAGHTATPGMQRNAGDGQWGELLHRVGQCIVSTFEARRTMVSAHLSKLPLSAAVTNAVHVYTGAENLLGLWLQLRQYPDALDFALDLANQFDKRFKQFELGQQQRRHQNGGHDDPNSTPGEGASTDVSGSKLASQVLAWRSDNRLTFPPAPILVDDQARDQSNSTPRHTAAAGVKVVSMRRWLFNIVPPTAAELAAHAPNFALEVQPYLFARIFLLYLELGKVSSALRYATQFIANFQRRVCINNPGTTPQASCWALLAALESLGAGFAVFSRWQVAAASADSPHQEGEGVPATSSAARADSHLDVEAEKECRLVAVHSAALFAIAHSALDQLCTLAVVGEKPNIQADDVCPFPATCPLSTMTWQASSRHVCASLHHVSSWINAAGTVSAADGRNHMSTAALPASLEALIVSNDQHASVDIVLQLISAQRALLHAAGRHSATAPLSLKFGLTLLCRSRWQEARLAIEAAKSQWTSASTSASSRALKNGPTQIVYGIVRGNSGWHRLDTLAGMSLLDCLRQLRDWVEVVKTGTMLLANARGSLSDKQNEVVHRMVKEAMQALTDVMEVEDDKDKPKLDSGASDERESSLTIQLEHGSLFSLSVGGPNDSSSGSGSGGGGGNSEVAKSTARTVLAGEVVELVVLVENHMSEPMTVREAGLDFRLDYLTMPGNLEGRNGSRAVPGGGTCRASQRRPRYGSVPDEGIVESTLDGPSDSQPAAQTQAQAREEVKLIGRELSSATAPAFQTRSAHVSSLASDATHEEGSDVDDDCDSRTVGSDEASTASENEMENTSSAASPHEFEFAMTDNGQASRTDSSSGASSDVDKRLLSNGLGDEDRGQQQQTQQTQRYEGNEPSLTPTTTTTPMRSYRSRSMDGATPGHRSTRGEDGVVSLTPAPTTASASATGLAGLYADPLSNLILAPGPNTLRFDVKTTGAVAGEYTMRRLSLRIDAGAWATTEEAAKERLTSIKGRELELSCAFGGRTDISRVRTLNVRALPLSLDASLVGPPMLVAQSEAHKVMIRIQLRGLVGVEFGDSSAAQVGSVQSIRSSSSDVETVPPTTKRGSRTGIGVGSHPVTTAELRVSLTGGRGRVSLDRVGISAESVKHNGESNTDGLLASSTSADHARFLDSSLFVPIPASVLAHAASTSREGQEGNGDGESMDVQCAYLDVYVWVSAPISRSSKREASRSGLEVAVTLFCGSGGPILGRAERHLEFRHGRPFTLSTCALVPQNRTQHQQQQRLILKARIQSLAPAALWLDSHDLEWDMKQHTSEQDNQQHDDKGDEKNALSLQNGVSTSGVTDGVETKQGAVLLSPKMPCYFTYSRTLPSDDEVTAQVLTGTLLANVRWVEPDALSNSGACVLEGNPMADPVGGSMCLQVRLPVAVSLRRQPVLSLCQVACEMQVEVGHMLYVKYVVRREEDVWTVDGEGSTSKKVNGAGDISGGIGGVGGGTQGGLVQSLPNNADQKRPSAPQVRYCVKLRGRGWLMCGVDRGVLAFESAPPAHLDYKVFGDISRCSFATLVIVLVAVQPGPQLLPVLETTDTSCAGATSRERTLDPCKVIRVSQGH